MHLSGELKCRRSLNGVSLRQMSDFDELHRLGLKLKFAYSIVGLIVGLACILVGLLLGVYGVAGHTSWTASVLGLSTNLSDAAPGVVVFVVGIFVVFLTVL